MQNPPAFIAPASAVLAVAAVAMAGFGGLIENQQLRLLFGGGAIFCLSMIAVFLVFISGLSYGALGGICAALGALAGLCMGLFDWRGGATLALYIVVGAAITFTCYWMRTLQSSSFWRG